MKKASYQLTQVGLALLLCLALSHASITQVQQKPSCGQPCQPRIQPPPTPKPKDEAITPINPIDLNPCSKLSCKHGCAYGVCLTQKCSTHQQCSDSESCIDQTCQESCSALTCPAGNTCSHGECVPISCKNDRFCAISQVCEEGICVEKCALAKCKMGYLCIHGECVREERKCKEGFVGGQVKGDGKCGEGEKCVGGRCQEKCRGVKCRENEICVNGKCESPKCKDSDCPQGFYCKDGGCVPSMNICTDDPEVIITPCTQPRPTPNNCPLPSFAPPGPGPAYCGITASGQRRNFLPIQCTVCQSSQILYYFNRPCSSAPFICDSSEECLGYYCSASGCKVNEECPYDWQLCAEGKCIDRCAMMRCADCRFGQCGYGGREVGSCLPIDGGNTCDLERYTCIGTGCVDVCQRQACPPYQKCLPTGECVEEVNPV